MNNWNECLASSVKIIPPDVPKSKSLVKIAQSRVDFLQNCESQKYLNFIFEGYYSCLLELLHANLLEAGYKVENHVCIGYFIRDVLNNDNLYRLFDDFRYKRNSLVYYGKEMDVDIAMDAVNRIKEVVKELSQ